MEKTRLALKTTFFICFYSIILSLNIPFATYCEEFAIESDLCTNVPLDEQYKGHLLRYCNVVHKKEPIATNETEKLEEVLPIKEAISIKIDTSNAKTTYLRGEEFDSTGLTVSVIYNTEEEEIIFEEEYAINEINTKKSGLKEVIITYNEISASYIINVDYAVDECESYNMYSTLSLNLRKGPGTEFDIAETIPINTEVTVTGIADNGWSQINYNGNQYYCSSKYLNSKKQQIVGSNSIEKTEMDRTTTTTESTSNIDTSLMIFDGNVSSDCQKKAIELYSYIPSNILTAIENEGYRIIVSTDSSYTDGHAGTYYPYIESHSYSSTYNGYGIIATYGTTISKVNISVLHEVGHFVDNYIGVRDGYTKSSNFCYPSITTVEEFQNIFTEEVWKSGFPSWANDCIEDYFAEAFWKVLTQPDWSKKTIPQTHEFIIKCIDMV